MREGEVMVEESSHVRMRTAHPGCLALCLIAAVTALFDGTVLRAAAEHESQVMPRAHTHQLRVCCSQSMGLPQARLRAQGFAGQVRRGLDEQV